VIDLHNYGRFSKLGLFHGCIIVKILTELDGYLIGDSGGEISDALFASFWAAIAAKYAGEPYVMFGLMNEVSPTTSTTYYGI
jgi:endoglucanase